MVASSYEKGLLNQSLNSFVLFFAAMSPFQQKKIWRYDKIGILIDEQDAQNTPCSCFQLGSGKLLCYTKGVMGFLNEEQKNMYCDGIYIRQATPEMERHLEEFSDMSHACSDKVRREHCKGERLMPFLDCMSEGGE